MTLLREDHLNFQQTQFIFTDTAVMQLLPLNIFKPLITPTLSGQPSLKQRVSFVTIVGYTVCGKFCIMFAQSTKRKLPCKVEKVQGTIVFGQMQQQ